MNIVDSSGWIEYFTGSDNADIYKEIINNSEELIVPSITITEVFKWIYRERDENSALIAIAFMKKGEIVDLTADLALNAAHYGRKYKLPLADSIIYASAVFYNCLIYTQDADFKGLENVKYFPKVRNN